MAKARSARGAGARAAASAPGAPAIPSRSPSWLDRALAGDRALAIALGLLAALLRVLFVVAGDDRAWPYTAFYEGDSEAFFRFARALLAGGLYDNGVPYHPPGFALMLAALHFLLGAGAADAEVPHFAVKVALAALVGGGGVAALFLAAARPLGRPVATLAALLASAHFGLYVLAIAPVADGLFQLLLLLAVAIFVRGLDFGRALRHGPVVALGLVLGALALTRAEGLGVLALVVVWGAVASARARPGGARERLRALLPWALVAGLALAVVAPWTIRNAVRLGALNDRLGGRLAEPLPRFVPVTIYGPLNLALANHDGADGSFSRAALAEQADVARLDLTNPEHLRWLLHGDRIARAWIGAHPGDFGRLVVAKWRLYFGALRLGWTQRDLPGGLAGVRRPVDVFVPDSALGAWILAPLLALGVVRLARGSGEERRWLGLVLALSGLSLGVVALFFGYARLAVVVLPLWLTLAAAALGWLGSALAARSPAPFTARRARLAALVAILALLGLELQATIHGHRLEASGTTLPGSGRLDRDQPVRFRPLPSP